MQQYLGKIKAKIILDLNPLIKLQQTNDLFLMEKIIKSKRFKPWELQRIQYCRLYLNVTLLLDVTKVEGTVINANFMHGIQSPHNSKSRMKSVK